MVHGLPRNTPLGCTEQAQVCEQREAQSKDLTRCIYMKPRAPKAGASAVRHSSQSSEGGTEQTWDACGERFSQTFCYEPRVIWGSCAFQFR